MVTIVVVSAGILGPLADLLNSADQCRKGRPSRPFEEGVAFGGFVMASNAESVGGVVVEIEDALGLQKSTTTGDGRFAMSRHPSGQTRVRVWRDGRAILTLWRVIALDPMVLVVPSTVPSPTTEVPSDKDLKRPYWQPPIFDQCYPSVGTKTVTLLISGLDHGSRNEPVVVELLPPYAPPVVVESALAAAGPITFDVPTGVSTVYASTSRLRSRYAYIPQRSVERPVPVALKPLDVITGCAVDSWGNPVVGATVCSIALGAAVPDPPTTFSDRHGRFHLVTCDDESMLRAFHPHHGSGSSGSFTKLEDRTHEHVILKPR